MTWTYRTVQDEADQFALDEAIFQSFFGFGRPRPQTRESTDWLGRENLRIVLDGDEVVGGLGLLPFSQWFGGRSVPTIGLSAVAIRPEYRGSGAGKFLIEQTVREMHASGAPMSTLYPSTWPFYRHAGYETAGARTTYKFDLRKIGRKDMRATMRPMHTQDREGVEAAYTAFARTQAGMADRTETNWARIFRPQDPGEYRYVVETADGIRGHLIYEQQSVREQPSELLVRDLCWLDEEAGLRILTFLHQHSILASPVFYDGAPVDPLLSMGRVENLEVRFNHYWMVRMLDPHKALEARGYPLGVQAELPFTYEDALLEPNQGNYVLQIADGQGTVQRGGNGGLTLGPRGLAPLFSGHLPAEDLRRMGLLDGDDATCRLASHLFSGPRPWMNDRF